MSPSSCTKDSSENEKVKENLDEGCRQDGSDVAEADNHSAFIETSRSLINSTKVKIDSVRATSDELFNITSQIKSDRGEQAQMKQKYSEKEHKITAKILSVPKHIIEKPKKKEVPKYMKKFSKLSDSNKFKLIEETLLKVKEADSLRSNNARTRSATTDLSVVTIDCNADSVHICSSLEYTNESKDDDDAIRKSEYMDEHITNKGDASYATTNNKTQSDDMMPCIETLCGELAKDNQSQPNTAFHYCNKLLQQRQNQNSATTIKSKVETSVKRHCCVTDHYTGPALLDDENGNAFHLHLPALHVRKPLTARSRSTSGNATLSKQDNQNQSNHRFSKVNSSHDEESRIRDEIQKHVEKLKLQKKWKQKVNCVQDFIKFQQRTLGTKELLRPKKITLSSPSVPNSKRYKSRANVEDMATGYRAKLGGSKTPFEHTSTQLTNRTSSQTRHA